MIAPDGSVEWLCLPRPDSASVFGALLDRTAGSFRFGPSNAVVPHHRRYVPGTMVVETTWHTPTGWLVVQDLFVVRKVDGGPRRLEYRRAPTDSVGVGRPHHRQATWRPRRHRRRGAAGTPDRHTSSRHEPAGSRPVTRTVCDPAGLAVLIGTQRRARLLGIVVRLAAPSVPVAKLLRLTGLDRSLTICPDLRGALAVERHEPAKASPSPQVLAG